MASCYDTAVKLFDVKQRFYNLNEVFHILEGLVNSLTTRDEIAEFANSVDLDEVTHNEPPHLDLHCLPSSL